MFNYILAVAEAQKHFPPNPKVKGSGLVTAVITRENYKKLNYTLSSYRNTVM